MLMVWLTSTIFSAPIGYDPQKLLLLYAHKCPITEFSSAIASFFLRKGGCVRGKDKFLSDTNLPSQLEVIFYFLLFHSYVTRTIRRTLAIR